MFIRPAVVPISFVVILSNQLRLPTTSLRVKNLLLTSLLHESNYYHCGFCIFMIDSHCYINSFSIKVMQYK